MSIIGRNPPPDLIAKRIHYCDRCGYGSSAGPCRSHHPESQHAAERNQMTVEPLRRGEDPHPGPFSAEGAEQARDARRDA